MPVVQVLVTLVITCLVYNKNTESCKSKIQKVAGGNSIVLQKTIAGITQNLYP
jgi:hypothetical protein